MMLIKGIGVFDWGDMRKMIQTIQNDSVTTGKRRKGNRKVDGNGNGNGNGKLIVE